MSVDKTSNLPAGPARRSNLGSGETLNLTDVVEILAANGTNPQVLAVLAARLEGVPPGHCPDVSSRDRSGVQRLPEVPKMAKGYHY